MNASIIYLTNRRDCRANWFCDSLCAQAASRPIPQVIFIDACLWEPDADTRRALFAEWVKGRFEFVHVPPKPNVWQGPTRLTKADYFAASNARNTGICHAQGDYALFVDDLSVLMPGWFDNMMHACHSNYVVQGAYRKVKELIVQDGIVKHWEPNIEGDKDTGLDCRWGIGSDGGILPSYPSNLYGCSFGAPMKLLLAVNGQDEIYDGMGYEDTALGFALANNGARFMYNRNMLTYEDGPAHFQGKPLLREDAGKSPLDASHTLTYGSKAYPAPSGFECPGMQNGNAYRKAIGNFFDITQLRKTILSGGKFPVPTKPNLRWFDHVPLKDLPN